MGQSFYEKEQKKIKSIIKLPLLELVLKFLPHLQPTVQEKDDTWEIVAIELTNLQYSKILSSSSSSSSAASSSLATASGGQRGEKPISILQRTKLLAGQKPSSKVVEELESMPELNGIYVRDYFEELFNKFKSDFQFSIAMNRPDTLDGSRSGNFMMANIIKDRSDALLYELYRLEFKDIELISKLSQEHLENKLRKQLNKLYKIPSHSQFHDDDKRQDGHGDDNDEEVKDGKYDAIFDSQELLEKYKTGSVNNKNQMLQDEISKKDKKLEQLKVENQRLLELNHELLEQMNGGNRNSIGQR
ncbi:conserved hypothetical protein [Candida dubliniensis CD36]|uniref:Uncharacterized protein n=1 Tax=Candida dubliniensis (strain CD36 / ATCC MYA-646 / CBS 7987 / NCPF 3949 / NRRL Y-17841) TaxID=573826 RepID=B9WEP8_CANDC|nr:conserved hypothetical protein [Candida dubliniensis CD36]CAX43160.1 conserved hypothetical protein [Candida dubliniensis CD36]